MAMLLGRARVDTLILLLISGKHQSFIMSYMIAVDFLNIFIRLESFLLSQFVEYFYHERVTEFVNAFSASSDHVILSFVLLQGILY